MGDACRVSCCVEGQANAPPSWCFHDKAPRICKRRRAFVLPFRSFAHHTRCSPHSQLLAEKKSAIDLVIFLNVDEEKLVERVVGRRVDPETGDSYHTTFNWPEDMSEEVKGRLIQRDDDTEEKCKVRLEQYRKNVEAIRGFYSDIGVEVDGNDKPEEVGVQIEKVMQDAKAKME